MHLFAAYLRRPRNSQDPRDDPYYTEGSFGSTGCHRDNLLNPRTTEIRKGDLLSFIQPGTKGQRLVYITPPIELHRRKFLEATWKPSKPLKYVSAIPLSGELARMVNPRSGDSVDSIMSSLRAFSQPAANPERLLETYREWIRSKPETAFAVIDRETLDLADQRKMSLTTYGKRGHAAAKGSNLNFDQR